MQKSSRKIHFVRFQKNMQKGLQNEVLEPFLHKKYFAFSKA